MGGFCINYIKIINKLNTFGESENKVLFCEQNNKTKNYGKE